MEEINDENHDLTMQAGQNERFEKLGFRPQKEIYFNRHLPYAEKLDDESQEILENIKKNLAKAVAMREMNPGIGVYASRLMAYMKLYGFKFSKEDHVKFIKLLLELICIPDLETSKVNKFCALLTQLLDKPYLLTREELEIDWRPLYELSKIYINKSSNKGAMYRFFPSLESNLFFVIQKCSLYFPKSATQEILDEIFPCLEPLDTGKECVVFELLGTFLNTFYGYELWFEKFMNLWDMYHNPPWNGEIMNIMAQTARCNIGRIDWEPYLPVMFTRILRSIDLPVVYKNMSSARSQSLWSSSISVWIVSVLGPQSSAQKYLDKFMGIIESYLHPANSGKWVNTLSNILVQLMKSFYQRIIDERYKRPSWVLRTPDSHKLTEECITAFVLSIKPVAFQAMYSRVGSNDVGKVFKYLADLRPELIIPGIIDRVYTTLDSLTEPHKMTAALQSLVSVSRSLVSGHNGYTEGRTHVIPLLMAILPGIDPNDFKKTSVVLQFLTSFALLVPIVDCSKAGQVHHNLTEEESLICEQSADFEDFVLQFLDKIFVLIDSSSVESIRMEQSDFDNMRSKLETISEAIIQSCSHGILAQCSMEILKSASRKMIQFVETHIFEPKVAGQLVGCLVRVFCRVGGNDVLRVIVPYLIDTIQKYFDDHEDIAEIEKQSDAILYHLILLVNALRGDPRYVIDYVDDVIPIIDQIMKFKCKIVNKMAGNMILNIMGNITTIQTMDILSSPEIRTKSLKDFLPIRHWGQKMKPNEKIEWYIPDERCKTVCEKLIHRYLPPILETFEKHIKDDVKLTRDEILKDLIMVTSLIRCTNFLPNWKTEESLKLVSSSIERYQINVTLGFEGKEIYMPDGSNVRLAIIGTVARLQTKILESSEDDIKSLRAIINVWDKVHMRRHYNSQFDTQLKTFNVTKFFQDFGLTHHKRSLRAVAAMRVLMQQDCRDELSPPMFTKSHEQVMINILKLSTSHYSAIRSLAQSKLFNMFSIYAFSYRCILDDLVSYLQLDSNEHHEAFKGALYILGGQRRTRLIVKHDWECVQKLWLSLLQSKLSEKPTVLKLLDMIVDAINNEFPTLTIELTIPDKCIDLALDIFPDKTAITPADIENGKLNLIAKNEYNKNIYHSILNSIIETVKDNPLHWRYNLMASSMIFTLVHPATKFPAIVARYTVHNLINDSLEERKLAIRILNFIMRQQKREHKKISIDPFAIAGVEVSKEKDLLPGVRSDNRWLQYDVSRLPKNQEDWDKPVYVHKSHGYFGWKTNFQVYAPTSEQPPLDRTVNQMTDVEQVVYEFFQDKHNVDKLITFWSLEEKKGLDKFNRSRFFLIKMIFGAFGDSFLDHFLADLPRLIDEKSSESNHRCSAEIMAGLMRATKHWPYDKTEKLFVTLTPLIRQSLKNITNDTDVFWGTCFATAAELTDPNRQYWLHEVLLEEPLRETTSFIDCSRIYCLQGSFNQHVWRMNSVAHRLLDYLRPFLAHPFQNVRERLGSILINIFEADLTYPGGNEPECPRVKDIIQEILPKLQVLHHDFPKIVPKTDVPMEVCGESNFPDSDYEKAVRLFKTISHWLIGVLNRTTNGNQPEYFELLPFACRLERCEQDAELAIICTSLLAMISQALTLPNCMDAALKKIHEVSLLSSWSARLAVIDVLQVLVFNNMSIVLSRQEWIEYVQEIVLRMLEDTIVEVREKAAEMLGSLIHCSFLPATDKLLELFKKKCRTKVIKSSARRLVAATSCAVEASKTESSSMMESREANAVRVRHTGVLGLCAFISAYPYDIPDFVPDVFEHLGAHLNDPQPIPSTIRKTMGDFKRTHHDNWATHQLKFTEDQLAVLSDLTVPPSYYA